MVRAAQMEQAKLGVTSIYMASIWADRPNQLQDSPPEPSLT